MTTTFERVSAVEYARKMVAAYTGREWQAERAWWRRKLEEREAEESRVQDSVGEG